MPTLDPSATRPRKRKSLSKKLRFEVLKRDLFKCRYCGKTAEEVPLHVDHVIPVASGGTNVIMNLVAACESCNLGKKAIPLDDRSVASKARKQAELLQEQKETIEMMAQWRAGLVDLAGQKADLLIKHWDAKTPNLRLAGFDRADVGKLLRKYSYEEVADAMDKAATQYLEFECDGSCTPQSFEKALGKLPAILKWDRRFKEDPDLETLFYFRAIARKRCPNYFPEREAMELLKEAREAGVSMDDLRDAAIGAESWAQFDGQVHGLICDASTQAQASGAGGLAGDNASDDFNINWVETLGDEKWCNLAAVTEALIETKSIAEIRSSKMWFCDVCCEPIESIGDARVLRKIIGASKWWPLIAHKANWPTCKAPADSEETGPLQRFVGADATMEIASIIQSNDYHAQGVAELLKRCSVPAYEFARFHFEDALYYDAIGSYLSMGCHWDWQIDRTLAWLGATGERLPTPKSAPEAQKPLVSKAEMQSAQLSALAKPG
jgi:hypothetical protein